MSMKKKMLRFAYLTMVCMCAHAAHADQVVLTNGDVIHGSFVELRDGMVVFQSDLFGSLRLSVSTIDSLDSPHPCIAGFVNGDVVRCQRLRIADGVLTVDSVYGSVGAAVDAVTALVSEVAQASAPLTKPPVSEGTPSQSFSGEGLEQTEASSVRNELSLGGSILSNQVSSGLAGTLRRQVSALQIGYQRVLDGNWIVGFSLPALYEIERVNDIGDQSRSTDFRLGDVAAFARKGFEVDVLSLQTLMGVSASASVPTGEDGTLQDTPDRKLGSGLWSAGAGIDLIVPLEFGALTAAVDYSRYYVKHRLDGQLKPVSDLSWSFGYTIGVREGLLFSNVLSGSVAKSKSTDSLQNDLARSEPAYLTFGLSYMIGDRVTLRPKISHGMNIDSNDFVAGVEIVNRW